MPLWVPFVVRLDLPEKVATQGADQSEIRDLFQAEPCRGIVLEWLVVADSDLRDDQSVSVTSSESGGVQCIGLCYLWQ